MQNDNAVLNIGYGNFVMADKIVAIASPDSAPIKRMVQDSKDKSTCIDATCGRRTKSVILTDSDYIVLSALLPETLEGRLTGKGDEEQ